MEWCMEQEVDYLNYSFILSLWKVHMRLRWGCLRESRAEFELKDENGDEAEDRDGDKYEHKDENEYGCEDKYKTEYENKNGNESENEDEDFGQMLPFLIDCGLCTTGDLLDRSAIEILGIH